MKLFLMFAVLAGMSMFSRCTDIAFAQETSVEPITTREHIAVLEPMIGTWEGKATVGGNESPPTVSYRWINHKNFILQTIDCPDIDLEVNHVIGWEPKSKSVRTWGFGGNGGHGEMVWTKKGPMNWAEESKDWTLPDGKNGHFLLETKVAHDKLEITGFFAAEGQAKTEMAISAANVTH